MPSFLSAPVTILSLYCFSTTIHNECEGLCSPSNDLVLAFTFMKLHSWVSARLQIDMVRYPAEQEFTLHHISWNLGIIHLAASNETWLKETSRMCPKSYSTMCLTKSESGGMQEVLLSVCLHVSVRKVSTSLLRQGRKRKLGLYRQQHLSTSYNFLGIYFFFIVIFFGFLRGRLFNP